MSEQTSILEFTPPKTKDPIMKASVYNQLTDLFPISPINAVSSLPESLDAGKTLTYIARITKDEINAAMVFFTEEDPKSKAFKAETYIPQNWKLAQVYDAEGMPLKEEIVTTKKNGDETAKLVLVKRWEPTHLKRNRVPTTGHISNLKLRFARTGYRHELRSMVFDWDGFCLDGQHSLLALWHYLNDYEVEYVDIDVKFIGKPKGSADASSLFRLFDQAMRKRSVKDALSTITGIPDGFAAEIASALRFSVLLANGRGINSSRLTLPHIVNDKQKPITLQADDVAGFITDSEPFDYYTDLLTELLKSTCLINPEDDKKGERMPTLCHPLVSGPGMPNAQYYLTAFADCLFDSQQKLSADKLYAKFREFLEEVYKGAESKHKCVVKLCTNKVKKAIEQLPAIESMLAAYLAGDDTKKLSNKVMTFNGIETKYHEWLTANGGEVSETEDAEEAA
jgi:hypothetical protein